MRNIESEILKGASELLHAHSAQLAAGDMTWQEPELVVWQTQSQPYESELRIMILKRGEIDDVLEFHIYLDGQQIVTKEEAVGWLNEQLELLEDLDSN